MTQLSLPLCQNHDDIIQATRQWLEVAVIGLNLCPFAKAVRVRNQIRYVVSDAANSATLLTELINELQALTEIDAALIDTTLLIHPCVLSDFLDYNDFLCTADLMLNKLKLNGILQIASFHPHYQFSGNGPDDIENYTNRSPYPMLHILREDSIDRAVAAVPDAAAIFARNIDTLKQLGHNGWNALGIHGDRKMKR